jgi:hypothetical protein
MSALDVAARRYADEHMPTVNGRPDAPPEYKLEVKVDDKGRATLVLPADPPATDRPAQLAWLTAVFGLNPAGRIIDAKRSGEREEGMVELRRAGSFDPVIIEPLRAVNTPARLIEKLAWALDPRDAAVPAYKADHCRRIAHVLRMACGRSVGRTHEEETADIIGAFLLDAQRVDGLTTYGTSPQRYEAADALRRDVHEVPRYLVDTQTGEIVVRAGDLAQVARRERAGVVSHKWLDGRMQALGWEKRTLDGHQIAGRAGRSGPHARCAVYRGLLPTVDDDPAVTT